MTERSRFWNGISIGDATEAAYDAPTEFAQVLMAVGNHSGLANRGRIIQSTAAPGTLQCFSPGANTARVATGEALVFGSWYQNDANVDVNIPTPGGATRIDRIVLRKSWAAQTIRVTRIAGAEGGGAPSLTQVIGTTWDFPIAQISITTGGAMTFTDQRKGITRNFHVPLAYAGTNTQPANDGTYGVPVFKFGDTGTNFADGTAPTPLGHIPTTPITFRFRGWAETATSGNLRLQAGASYIPASGSTPVALGDGGSNQTIAVPGSADNMVEFAYTSDVSPPTGQWTKIRFTRLGSDGADTAAGDLNVIASCEVEYESYW